jgi:hypothetical protein
MNTRMAALLASFCLVAGGALAAMGHLGQTTQTSAPPSTQQTTSSQGSSTTSAPASSQPTDKKVWTNDDVGDLRDHAPISTIGNANPKSKPVDKPANSPKGAKSAKWYIDQIHALQAKIPPLDDKIQQLQAALRGDQVNAVRQYGGVRPDDWRDQLQRLQKERGDIEAKISVLEDQARHDGVAPNLLPQQDTN